MTVLEDIISHLLLRHNCVVIPSFGGFITKVESAKVNMENGSMTPPSKSLLFNRQLINNDGLLIAELAKENSSTYSEAEKSVHATVADWDKKLRSGERITIDRVGHLFYDSNKNICFEQDRFFNLLLGSFGLGSVDFIPEVAVSSTPSNEPKERVFEIEDGADPVAEVVPLDFGVPKQEEQEKKKIISIVGKQKKAQEEQTTQNSSRKIWKYVAAACLLPIAFYAVWIPMKTDVLESGVLSFQDFNPLHQQENGTYSQKGLDITPNESQKTQTLDEQIANLDNSTTTYHYNFTEDFFIPVRIKDASASPEVAVKSEAISNNKKYNYIVGCFGETSNAKNMIQQLRNEGLQAFEVDVKGGLHRISAGSGASRKELQTIIQKAKSLGHKGWVLKK